MILAIILVLSSASLVSAQNPANATSFITSITYQNVGTAPATVSFQFFNEKSASATSVSRTLPAGAGSSLFVGGLTGSEALPASFLGSSVLSSNQPIVATLVQLPQSTTVKNRPLSNGFSSATSSVLLATVLKNVFNTNSKFSIQNADTGAIDITLNFFNADNPSAPAIVVTESNIPQGAAKYYDMATLGAISAATFNGSATVTAVRTGTTTPANIVGSVLELGLGGSAVNDAKAFEGVTGGSRPIFMATALCNVFGGTNTAYAVQNTGTSPANVTVTYSSGTNEAATLQPGTKKSFLGCTVNPANFSGAATITSDVDIVVIGKVFGGNLATAFLGEKVGSPKLALPYVRWASDANFNSGERQRTFIAIQNVGTTAVNNVIVEYRDKNGTVVGTHTIASIAPGAKANSRAIDAGNTPQLIDFGGPEANPGGGFGGAVTIRADGAQLVAIARVQSKVGAVQVAEDYNGVAVQ
jgi:hypothetical protein